MIEMTRHGFRAMASDLLERSGTDLNRPLQRLCDADIELVIVGCFAAMLHAASFLIRPEELHTILAW